MITPFLSDGMGRRPIAFLPDDYGFFKPLIAIRKLWKGTETTFDPVAAHGGALPFTAYLPIIGQVFDGGPSRALVLVVQCNFCMTEYRLDEALLKGAKGACIRCPKCRERIIVANPHSPPEVPPVALPTAVETGFPPIAVSAPEGMTSPVARDRRAEGADLSEMIRPDPVAGFDDGIVVSPTPEAAPDPPEIPGRMALRLEDLFIHPSAVEGDRIPGGGDYGPMVIRPSGPGWKPPPRRPLYRRPLFLAAAISILLLAGGTFYFVDGNSGRKSSDSVIPARSRSIPENSVFDVGNVKGFLNRKTSGESFFVVKGTVTNIGKALSNGIRIEVDPSGQG